MPTYGGKKGYTKGKGKGIYGVQEMWPMYWPQEEYYPQVETFCTLRTIEPDEAWSKPKKTVRWQDTERKTEETATIDENTYAVLAGDDKV